MELSDEDICRVCRSEGTVDKPLFHPCVCTGSIKFIHQDCLLQWLKHSRKEYCELCKHRFTFTPIYSPDMPPRLPVGDVVAGLLASVGTALRFWFHYTLVAFAWLGVVPLTACRIYKCLFTGCVSSLLTLPMDMLSTENILVDCLQGCLVVTCTLCAFISLVWLREQIMHGGAPPWLEQNHLAARAAQHQQQQHPQQQQQPQQPDGQQLDPEPPGEARVAQALPADAEDDEDEENVDEGDEEEEQAGDNANNDAQDMNWNALEWDRAAEELTWERILGLDGSLIFLEHVFWVVSLNTLFILVFAFCPYHIGHFSVIGLGFKDFVEASHFEGLITTIVGYVLLAFTLILCHGLASLVRFQRSRRLLGVCYIVVKVSLLVVMEIGAFPLVCGWWLDICSLEMFDATMKDREASFQSAPGTTMFLHWLVGMVYVFYFASFVLLLREVLRPGVLWFLRNINDPDFNPVQEMIHLPLFRHARRFLLSTVVFGSIVVLMLWLPIRIIKGTLPSFLPYNVTLYSRNNGGQRSDAYNAGRLKRRNWHSGEHSDAPVSELSLELLLLQVVLPALLEQGHTRHWLKGLLRAWTRTAAYLLDLHSYLLGDQDEENENNAENAREEEEEDDDDGEEEEEDDDDDDDEDDDEEEVAEEELLPPLLAAGRNGIAVPIVEGLHAAHQAMLQQGGPTEFQPYTRPLHFTLRIFLLIGCICLTLLSSSLTCLVVPVLAGRYIMSMWAGGLKLHELYTAACGLYACWLAARGATVLASWAPQGRRVLLQRLKERTLMVLKTLLAAFLLAGVVPLLVGLLFELVVVVPLRVPLHQTPLFFPLQDWALGVLHTKIVAAITLMGPQWRLKAAIEQVYANGLRNLDMRVLLLELTGPVTAALLLALCVPYAVSFGLVPLLGLSAETQTLAERRVYPCLLGGCLVLGVLGAQLRQFRRLYEHIKNDKYLVGQRLVNYERKSGRSSALPSDL
ncbi:E3 ubiquitin-protein ligase MARCHF6 isoform X2 [Petromyzon marinus]|uniref:E3 ubiquitin-protein ligase MARCHF6 isoform X2 n=1 Tax=Petromyzon marinus TaxID=7757 RepID=UPI003F6F67F0